MSSALRDDDFLFDEVEDTTVVFKTTRKGRRYADIDCKCEICVAMYDETDYPYLDEDTDAESEFDFERDVDTAPDSAKLLYQGPMLRLTKDELLAGHLRRYGTSNPEVQNIPYCTAVIEADVTPDGPYGAFDIMQQELPDAGIPCCPRPAGGDGEALWTWSGRRGQTETRLEDGRVVKVGGFYRRHGHCAYEDQFSSANMRDEFHCAYNDVMVLHGQDQRNTFGYGEGPDDYVLYGYPRAVLPPLANHTATLAKGAVYLIGGRMTGSAGVWRLDTATLAVEEVETTGEKPLGLTHHATTVTADGLFEVTGGVVEVVQADGSRAVERKANADVFVLDMRTKVWEKRNCWSRVSKLVKSRSCLL